MSPPAPALHPLSSHSRRHLPSPHPQACYEGLRSIGPAVAGVLGLGLFKLHSSMAGMQLPGCFKLQQHRLHGCNACHLPLPLTERFTEIVKVRNKLARVAGFSDYYAMKLQQAGMVEESRGGLCAVQRGRGGAAALRAPSAPRPTSLAALLLAPPPS